MILQAVIENPYESIFMAIDETTLKTAIRGLANRSTIKPEIGRFLLIMSL
jgi:hypothetical protein